MIKVKRNWEKEISKKTKVNPNQIGPRANQS